MNNHILVWPRVVLFSLAAVMIRYGLTRGEVSIVFKKAVRICLECIGIG